LSEHMDVRVRAGPPGARSAGQSSQPDIGETGMPAPTVLATFAETKVARAVGRRGKRHGRRIQIRKFSQVLPSSGASRRLPPQVEEGKKVTQGRHSWP